MRGIHDGSYFLFKDIDLTGIKKITYSLSSKDLHAQIELHLDSANGPVISTAKYRATGDWNKKVEVSAPVTPTSSTYDLYFVAKRRQKPDKNILMLD
jgi:cytochrome c